MPTLVIKRCVKVGYVVINEIGMFCDNGIPKCPVCMRILLSELSEDMSPAYVQLLLQVDNACRQKRPRPRIAGQYG
jgi:hypothetical protein